MFNRMVNTYGYSACRRGAHVGGRIYSSSRVRVVFVWSSALALCTKPGGRSNGQPTQTSTAVPELTHGPHISYIDRSNDNQHLSVKTLYITRDSEPH